MSEKPGQDNNTSDTGAHEGTTRPEGHASASDKPSAGNGEPQSKVTTSEGTGAVPVTESPESADRRGNKRSRKRGKRPSGQRDNGRPGSATKDASDNGKTAVASSAAGSGKSKGKASTPATGKSSRGNGSSGGGTPPPARSSGKGGGVALIIAIIALIIAVIAGGWQFWQARHGGQQVATELQATQDKVASLGKDVTAVQQGMGNLQTSANRAVKANRAALAKALRTNKAQLDQQVAGLTQRIGTLEDATATLARRQQNARSGVTIGQVTMLLQFARQRYTLFHDAQGAIDAYATALKVMDAADDPGLMAVRRAASQERQALVDSHPVSQALVLSDLDKLRAAVVTLPLASQADDETTDAQSSSWQQTLKHVWDRVAKTVVVKKDTDLAAASSRLAHQLAELDVVRAQMAYLAWNFKQGHAALQDLSTRLERDFAANDPKVEQARKRVTALLKQAVPQFDVELGQALQLIGNQKQVRAAGSAALNAPANDEAKTPAKPAGAAQ